MEENKGIKVRLSTVILLFIIFILLIALFMTYYIYSNQNKELNIKLNSVLEAEKELTIEPTNDKDNNYLNGELNQIVTPVYDYGEPISNESIVYLKYGYLYFAENEKSRVEEISGLSNIKSLKVYNIGSGINKVPFVVTKTGEVYRLNNNKELVKYKELEKYNVEEIIEHSGEMYDIFKILLKDGKIVTIQINEKNEVIEKEIIQTKVGNKDIVQENSYGEPIFNDNKEYYLKDGYLYSIENENNNIEKFSGLSNIKSLKVYNIGSGINKVPFVVTETGEVYRLDSKEKFVRYKELEQYNVEEIIEYTGEMYSVFKILLTDGTIKTVEVK